MKKYNYIAITFAFLSLTGCGDGIDLPSLGVETDLNKIILPDNNINLIQAERQFSTYGKGWYTF